MMGQQRARGAREAAKKRQEAKEKEEKEKSATDSTTPKPRRNVAQRKAATKPKTSDGGGRIFQLLIRDERNKDRITHIAREEVNVRVINKKTVVQTKALPSSDQSCKKPARHSKPVFKKSQRSNPKQNDPNPSTSRGSPIANVQNTTILDLDVAVPYEEGDRGHLPAAMAPVVETSVEKSPTLEAISSDSDALVIDEGDIEPVLGLPAAEDHVTEASTVETESPAQSTTEEMPSGTDILNSDEKYSDALVIGEGDIEPVLGLPAAEDHITEASTVETEAPAQSTTEEMPSGTDILNADEKYTEICNEIKEAIDHTRIYNAIETGPASSDDDLIDCDTSTGCNLGMKNFAIEIERIDLSRFRAANGTYSSKPFDRASGDMTKVLPSKILPYEYDADYHMGADVEIAEFHMSLRPKTGRSRLIDNVLGDNNLENTDDEYDVLSDEEVSDAEELLAYPDESVLDSIVEMHPAIDITNTCAPEPDDVDLD